MKNEPKTENMHLRVSPIAKEMAQRKADELFGGNVSAYFTYLMLQEKDRMSQNGDNISSNDNSGVIATGKSRVNQRVKKVSK